MDYLKRFWNWLLNKTTIDEKIEAKVAEVKKEVIEAKAAINTAIKETGDIAKAVTPKKRKSKPRRSGASAQTVSKSGASSQSFKK